MSRNENYLTIGDLTTIVYRHFEKDGTVFSLATGVYIDQCKMYFRPEKCSPDFSTIERAVEFTAEAGGDGKLQYVYDSSGNPPQDSFLTKGWWIHWTKVVYEDDSGNTRVRQTRPKKFRVYEPGEGPV